MATRSRLSRADCLAPDKKKTWMKPPPPRGARKRALLTVDRLRDLYPAATELDHENPFQLLIATILSAQTTDRSVNLVTPELFRRYPTAEDLAAADPAELQKLLKPTGFFRAKTQRIIAASRKLVELFGGEVPQDMDGLVKIPGDRERDSRRGIWRARLRGGHPRDPPHQSPGPGRDQGPGEDRVPGVLDGAEGGVDRTVPPPHPARPARLRRAPAALRGMRAERFLPLVPAPSGPAPA